MTLTRRNVWELGGDWADPILWYARAVKAMKARPLADPTSWRSYGAIHGFDAGLWQQFGYLNPSEAKPAAKDVSRYWVQCQHGSWYFLPWHRGYLFAFEANLKAAIKDLNGPPDWALPYWNYFKPQQSKLPPAFASPDWPDGRGDNPLFVKQRYGPNDDGNVSIPVSAVNLKAMTDPDFTGVATGGSRGFGGIDTGFEHGGPSHGRLEQQPHDQVHVLIGGGDPQDPQSPGLMSDPDTAGLDPIFWLHHANIDRLWQVWRQNPATHLDPTDAKWLKGPASTGGRAFSMPLPGNTSYDYVPADVVDSTKLGYTYDDLSAAVSVPPQSTRLQRLGMGAVTAAAVQGGPTVAGERNVELVGANSGALRIEGNEARTSVQLDRGMRQKVSATLAAVSGARAAAAGTDASPDRVFLNLENVRGRADSTLLQVYVGVPQGANPADHPERLAGSVALFGVRKATLADGEHAGQGLTYSLEITDIVDALHLSNQFDVDTLDVRLVPLKPVSAAAQISVGRISIFRQGR
jgi:tyrosinase